MWNPVCEEIDLNGTKKIYNFHCDGCNNKFNIDEESDHLRLSNDTAICPICECTAYDADDYDENNIFIGGKNNE